MILYRSVLYRTILNRTVWYSTIRYGIKGRSNMIFSMAENLVRDSFSAAMQEATRARKSDAAKRLDYYHDFQTDYIKDALAAHFSNPEKLTPCFVNIVRKVINRLAMVYVQDARRKVEGTDRDQEIFSEIERGAWLGAKWKLANRYSKLLGLVAMRPVWRNGALDVDLVTPDILDVTVGDSPEDVRSFMVTNYPESGRQDELTYSLWTPEAFKRLDYRGHEMEVETNPYGTIPYQTVWNRVPTDSFWTPGASDLVTLQESFNEKLTDLLYVLRMQGFGVGYVKGMKGELSNVDPGTFFNLPADGELGYAATNAPVTESLAVLDFLLKQAAVSNGLPASSLTTDPTDESGVAKVAGNIELEELRRDDVELFRAYERRLFRLIKTVWNHHNPGRKFSEKAELVVDFFDQKPNISADKQAETWDRLLTMGVISPVDIMLERNPDLTRDEAKARLVEIQDENREFLETKI